MCDSTTDIKVTSKFQCTYAVISDFKIIFNYLKCNVATNKTFI